MTDEARELIADLRERGVLLATDGARLWSPNKGITSGVAAEIAPHEADIIKELHVRPE